MLKTITTGIVCLMLLGACTERRRDTVPVPDGDTVRVVIPDRSQERESRVRIIEVDDEPQPETVNPNDIRLDPSDISTPDDPRPITTN